MPFDPVDLTASDNPVEKILSEEIWIPILEHDCAFPPHIFAEVMLNLIKNPNFNSSHLFRADILYDSQGTLALAREQDLQLLSDYNLKEHGIPFDRELDYEQQRTIVRKLIPRNQQLDRALIQSCHFFKSNDDAGEETNMVVYIPHLSDPTEVPHYHPAVKGIAFLHHWNRSRSNGNISSDPDTGAISIHYALFPSTPLTERLRRTAHQLLSTLHRHGQGALAGYVKRVHHDLVIPQQRVQDTYADLKARHAKRLIDNWVEKTQPSKHVFEDLGIAAFLIELWRETYGDVSDDEGARKDDFPGFVDIGCGNGVLVDVLMREGYRGWGFDARKKWQLCIRARSSC